MKNAIKFALFAVFVTAFCLLLAKGRFLMTLKTGGKAKNVIFKTSSPFQQRRTGNGHVTKMFSRPGDINEVFDRNQE